jgi:hypothetical protein
MRCITPWSNVTKIVLITTSVVDEWRQLNVGGWVSIRNLRTPWYTILVSKEKKRK